MKNAFWQKYYLVVLVGIFIGAFALINIQYVKDEKVDKVENNSTIIESVPELIIQGEDVQPELYNPEQMYFEDIHYLMSYLTVKEIEQVKEQIQEYIKSNIKKEVLDCYINKDSIGRGDNTIFFEFSIEGGVQFRVVVNKGSELTVEIKSM